MKDAIPVFGLVNAFVKFENRTENNGNGSLEGESSVGKSLVNALGEMAYFNLIAGLNVAYAVNLASNLYFNN